MPLTPEDVQNKEFTTVRLREGYEMQEVDEFLDEVEAELARLLRENEELRQKLAAVTRGGAAASAEPVQAPEVRRPEPVVQPEPPRPAPAPAPVAAAVTAAPYEAAAKVLALAQKTADELVADAKSEADKLLGDSQSRSEQLDADTKMRADKLEAEARNRAETIDREARDRREQIFGSLESERTKLERSVESLRAFEREYRSRLKAYLEGQLRQLETSSVSDGQAPAGNNVPSGAQSGGRPVASLLEDDQRR
jgi:DivIVA domain-containing protein